MTQSTLPTPVDGAPQTNPSSERIETLEREARERRAQLEARVEQIEAGLGEKAEAVAERARQVRAFAHENAWLLAAGATAAGLALGWGTASKESKAGGDSMAGFLFRTAVRAAAGRVIANAIGPGGSSAGTRGAVAAGGAGLLTDEVDL